VVQNIKNRADAAIAFALQQVGKPYQWGATGPNAFDCSGLAMAAWEAAGVEITRTTYTQVHQGSAVNPSIGSLLPGDLVFPDPGHVQIYVGGNQIVEAPHTGANVRTGPVRGIWAARRVSEPGTPITGVIQTADPTITQQAGIFDWATGLGDFFDKITNPYFWLRVGEIIAGIALVILAVVVMNKGRIEEAGKIAAKVAVV